MNAKMVRRMKAQSRMFDVFDNRGGSMLGRTWMGQYRAASAAEAKRYAQALYAEHYADEIPWSDIEAEEQD